MAFNSWVLKKGEFVPEDVLLQLAQTSTQAYLTALNGKSYKNGENEFERHSLLVLGVEMGRNTKIYAASKGQYSPINVIDPIRR